MEAFTITDRFAGADWVLVFNVNDLDPGFNLSGATLILKETERTPDAQALYTKAISSAYVQWIGQIIAGTPPQLQFEFRKTETGTLTPQKPYYCKVLIDDAAQPFTDALIDGSIIPR